MLGRFGLRLDASDGSLAWKLDEWPPHGILDRGVLAEGKVFIANRGGVYYALGQGDGKAAWRRDLGVPVLMSSA